MFQTLIVDCVDLSRRYAPIVVGVALAVAVACVVLALNRLGISTDTADMIAPDLPFRQDSRAFDAAFPQLSDTIVIVIDGQTADHADVAAITLRERLEARRDLFRSVFAPAAEPFFRRNGLLYLAPDELAALADRLAAAQPLLGRLVRDPTLRGLFDVMALAAREGEGGADADRLYRAVATTIGATLDDRDAPLSWIALFDAAAGKDRRRFVIVQPKLDYTSLAPAAPAMAAIRKIAHDAGLTSANGVEIRLTGGAALDTEELATVREGAARAGLLSLLLVAVILAVGVRSARLVGAILVTLVIGLLWTVGFATLAVGRLNLISVAFAVLFIGLAVDFGIHFGLRVQEALPGDLGAALRQAASGAGPAIALAALAAALGFLAFVPTDYAGLSELGVIAGAGMALALLANLTVLPALLALLGPPAALARRAAPGRAGRWIAAHGRTVTLGAVVLAIASAFALPFVRFDADPIALKDQNVESARTFHDLLKDPNLSPYTIDVLAPNLGAADALAARLRKLPMVGRAVTVSDLVPTDQDAKFETLDAMSVFLDPTLAAGRTEPPPDNADRRAALETLRDALAQAPRSQAAVALDGALARLAARAAQTPSLWWRTEDALLRFLPPTLDRLRLALEADTVTVDTLPETIRARYLAKDGRARIEVYPAQPLDDIATMRRFVDQVRAVAPNATSAPVTIVESGDAVVGAMRQATATALIAIAATLLLLLRSLTATLLALFPVALASVFTVATTAALGLPFNFANIIVLPLLLGLGVASGLHLVMRAHSGAGLAETSTPRAVVLSALTTIGSFGTLAISSHRGTASMGEFLMIAIVYTLICALIVLPALMAWRAGRGAA